MNSHFPVINTTAEHILKHVNSESGWHELCIKFNNSIPYISYLHSQQKSNNQYLAITVHFKIQWQGKTVYNRLFNFQHQLFWGSAEVKDTNVNLCLEGNQNHKVLSISKAHGITKTKREAIVTLNAAGLFQWITTMFQSNPVAHWRFCPAYAQVKKKFSHGRKWSNLFCKQSLTVTSTSSLRLKERRTKHCFSYQSCVPACFAPGVK
jgi:hypothetical protein